MKAEVAPLAVARVAAAAARAVTGVADLDGGPLGEFATYGGGKSERGVRVSRTDDPRRVEVRVVVTFGRPLPGLTAAVRQAVAAAVVELEPGEPTGEPRVDVHVADLRLSELPAAP